MFDQLFSQPAVIARHTDAPFFEERTRYLNYCKQRGDASATLLLKARELLWIARKLETFTNLNVSLTQLHDVAGRWEARESACGQKLNEPWTRRRFIHIASAWLRYLGYLQEPKVPIPFEPKLESYCRWAEHERGLSASTINRFRSNLAQFLRWYGQLGQPIEGVRVVDVDAYLAYGHQLGWCRLTMRNVAKALRIFFRFGAQQGWCDVALAKAIVGPRIYAVERLPAGPAWPDVQRLFEALDPSCEKDVRDRPMLMLLSIYGLRESEVTGLRLDDFDWDHDLLHVVRAKRREAMTYPLIPSLRNAVVDYVRGVRPPSTHRQVFLGLTSPHRPLSRAGIYHVVAPRLKALKLQIEHFGPHSLRHACAARLMAEGFTLKEIGDHLGHRSTAATRIYTKVDLAGLREVADFDLGELP